jgi:AraC-like DNA-binding protein
MFLAELPARHLGEGPYPCPMGALQETFYAYGTNQFIVLTPKTTIDFTVPDFQAHESYEFIMPFTAMRSSTVVRTKLVFEHGKFCVISPWQEQGPTEPLSGCRFLALQVDRMFVRDLARSIYRSDEPVFPSSGFPVDREITGLIQQLCEESVNRQAGYHYIVESISTQIMVKLLRELIGNMPPLVKERNYTDGKTVNRVIEFFRESYNKPYSMQIVAQMANLSPYHFIRIFKAHTGKTPYCFLMDIKLEKARTLLMDRRLTITDVSDMCGFTNLNHFGSVFKRKTGMSPSEYRKYLQIF